MSEKEDIQYHYEEEVKGLCANMAADIIAHGYQTADWEANINEALIRREKALKELKVSIDPEHLQVLIDWFVEACKSSPYETRGRHPICFGTGCRTYGPPANLADSDLCQACKAISPLLKDDC